MPDFIKKKMEDKKDDKKEDKKDDKKDGEAMKKGKYSEAENLEEQESKTAEEQAEAAEKALDTASTPTENAIASTVDEGEELQNMRSSASEWIGSFINSKTK